MNAATTRHFSSELKGDTGRTVRLGLEDAIDVANTQPVVRSALQHVEQYAQSG